MSRQAVLTIFALSAIACSSSDERVEPKTASVVFEGEATPEALEVMTSAESKEWEWAAGVPETPEEGAVLPAANPATFTWSSDLIYEPGPQANAPGLSAVAFWLKFSSADGRLLEVFTTKREYTPSNDAWQRLGTGGLSLAIDSAIFEANALVPEKGPFHGIALGFSIE